MVYTPQEVAEMLKVSLDIVIILLEQEKMGGFKVGDLWRITPEQFENFIKQNSTGDKKLIKKPNRYNKLEDYLKDTARNREIIEVSFEEVEKIIQCKLPQSAYKYRAWWASDPTHSQGLAWINAGWNVEFVNMKQQIVQFIRVGTND